jgi:hypothetical protein
MQVVTMKNADFWDVPPRGSCYNWRFGGDAFLRNVGSNKTHTAPCRRRPHSSMHVICYYTYAVFIGAS